jgi:hypothetical protein
VVVVVMVIRALCLHRELHGVLLEKGADRALHNALQSRDATVRHHHHRHQQD